MYPDGDEIGILSDPLLVCQKGRQATARFVGEATHRRLTQAHEYVFRVFKDMGTYVGEAIGTSLNMVRHGFKGVTDTKRTPSWTRPGSEKTVLAVAFDVGEAGDEFVIELSGGPVYRTPLVAPRYDSEFDEAIREELIAPQHEAVTQRE